MMMVVSSKNGSMLAEFGSGMSNMSEASMPFQPAIEEPSNAWPEANLSSSKCETGTVVCCCLPRVSVKRKSTNLTFVFFHHLHDVCDGLGHQILLVESL